MNAANNLLISPKTKLHPGNYSFTLEQYENNLPGNIVNDVIRLIVLEKQTGSVKVQFKMKRFSDTQKQ